MKAFYRGHSYDPKNMGTDGLKAGDVASFRGHSFQLGESIPSTSSFGEAQFRGHALIAGNRRSLSKTRRPSDRLSRTIESLEGKQVAH